MRQVYFSYFSPHVVGLCPLQSVNDSKPLALMIYSSFFFLALRIMVFVAPNMVAGESNSTKALLQKVQTIFISIDAVTIVIIFFSRLFMKEKIPPKPSGTSGYSVAQLRSNVISRRSSFREGARGSFGEERFNDGNLQGGERNQVIDFTTTNTSTVRFKMNGKGNKTIDLPGWVLDKYGSFVTTENDGHMYMEVESKHGSESNVLSSTRVSFKDDAHSENKPACEKQEQENVPSESKTDHDNLSLSDGSDQWIPI